MLLNSRYFFLTFVNPKKQGVLYFFLVKNNNFILALALILRLNLSFFNRGVQMVNDFNKHLGEMLKKRRLALGLTQTKVAKAINVTFQQIQKYEKGINGVSSVRLLQLASYLKVPINYFFDNYSEYLNNLDKTAENYMSVNYNFLVKIFSELTQEQKNKFNKLTSNEINLINEKTG